MISEKKKKMDWALIRLICAMRLMVIQWLWPHFCVIESPRALSKTAFEYKWIMPSLLWPLAVTLIQLAVTIKRELGNLLTQQRYVPRKCYSYFNTSMQWRASARWKTSKWRSAQHLCFPEGRCLVTALPLRKPPLFTWKFREESRGSRSTVLEYVVAGR